MSDFTKIKVIPCHYIPAMPVSNWLGIKEQAEDIAKWIDAHEYGPFHNEMFGLHHAQVSEKPLSFFVLNPEHLKVQVADLGSRFIVNPKITKYNPQLVMQVQEGCVSFPYRTGKLMTRAMMLGVEYEIPDPTQPNGLRKMEKQVERIIAQIFQHEVDHGLGKNMYFDSPKS